MKALISMDGWLIASTLALGGLAVGGTALLTSLVRWIAPRLGFIDCPDGRRKTHRQPTPLLGGVALYSGLVITTLGAGVCGGFSLLDAEVFDFLIWTLVTAGVFCAIGIWDDRWPLRPTIKFQLQLVACLPFALWGRHAHALEVFGSVCAIELLGIAFTLFWLVTCVNAFNLLDGMDGQASSLGILACLSFSGMAALQGDFGTCIASLLIVGNLLGFLWYNRPPARIFLGDAGSLTIGFLAGAISLKTSTTDEGHFSCLIPMVVLGLPLFDTGMAIIRRKLCGRGISEADREHIHHCLQDKGFSRGQALGIVIAYGAALASVAVLACLLETDLLAVLGCGAILASLVSLRLFGFREFLLFKVWCTQVRFSPVARRPRHFNPLEWLAF